MEHLSCDVLVIGSGAAGLRAAIAAREKGLQVSVVSKGSPGKATCTWLSGGVMAGTPPGDKPEEHLERTLLAGRGINQRELVEVLVAEAPQRLQELISWGIRAEYLNGYLYAQGRPPVLGEEIIRCLIQRNQALGTRFPGNMLVTDLVMEEGSAGVSAYAQQSGTWFVITARALVLASGGASALYLRHDNPSRMLGNGWRLALEAGATLQDLEFVQFYPLALAEPGLPPLVIPPRLADCGRLANSRQEEILDEYGITERPAAERARDRLSQALFREIYRDGHEVWLDLRDLRDDQWWIDPFSAAVAPILGERYGARHRPVRVAPVAHHVMGGVKIDPAGATSLPGLFAAGETAGGLHGANRMGGNALSETLVLGARAGSSAAAWAQHSIPGSRHALLQQLQERTRQWQTIASRGAGFLENLREIMWQEGGIIRSQQSLERALETVRSMQEEPSSTPSDPGHSGLQKTIECFSATQAATLILEAAIRRCESRGAHFREDFPEQDEQNWRGHLQVQLSPSGERVWHFQPPLP